ncbi:hypothetical protein Catovirus_1_146 [Catovirus CTV1]|uniref:Uncharacterized protein n=1 Tax=Catovirus CTV1 TaxID=1977631 RepID=A0A1V0S8S1_9VIRU|nr:hypothetical protein Catovirus_1_146 [Catovirus CTV1]
MEIIKEQYNLFKISKQVKYTPMNQKILKKQYNAAFVNEFTLHILKLEKDFYIV